MFARRKNSLVLNEPEIHLNGLLGHEEEAWVVLQTTPMPDQSGPFMLYVIGRMYGKAEKKRKCAIRGQVIQRLPFRFVVVLAEFILHNKRSAK